jgi:CBS domain-containing protein
MLARDLMRKDVFTVRESDTVDHVAEMLTREHIHGAPVLDDDGHLVGVVTQQDMFFATMTVGPGAERPAALHVRDIMTSPAVAADEETEVRNLCRMMHRLRIHRIPIVRDGRVTGIVSSLDVCRLVAQGLAP